MDKVKRKEDSLKVDSNIVDMINLNNHKDMAKWINHTREEHKVPINNLKEDTNNNHITRVDMELVTLVIINNNKVMEAILGNNMVKEVMVNSHINNTINTVEYSLEVFYLSLA